MWKAIKGTEKEKKYQDYAKRVNQGKTKKERSQIASEIREEIMRLGADDVEIAHDLAAIDIENLFGEDLLGGEGLLDDENLFGEELFGGEEFFTVNSLDNGIGYPLDDMDDLESLLVRGQQTGSASFDPMEL